MTKSSAVDVNLQIVVKVPEECTKCKAAPLYPVRQDEYMCVNYTPGHTYVKVIRPQ